MPTLDRMRAELCKPSIEFNKLKEMKADPWMPEVKLQKCDKALGAVEVDDTIHAFPANILIQHHSLSMHMYHTTG